MTWGRLDDGLCQHPKVIGLSHEAFRLFVASICYANHNATDGRMSWNALYGVPTGLGRAPVRRRVTELVDARLLDVDGDAFVIHDFLTYNPSAATVATKRDELREARAKAGREGAKAKWQTDGKSMANDEQTHGPKTQTENPVPTPILSLSVTAGARSASDWYFALNHRVPPTAVSRQVVQDMDVHGVLCLAWAFEMSADKRDPWTYGKKVLDSCAIEGHGPRTKGVGNGRTEDIGTDEGRRAVRQNHGRYLPASQRVAGAGVDWDREEREQERLIARANGRTEGTSENEVG